MDATRFQILVMEGETSLVEGIRAWLRDCRDPSFDLDHAGSLMDGLQKLAATPVDALLLSLDLPDSQGLATITEVHAHFRSLPIVVLVPQAGKDLGRRALRAGASDYLAKESLSQKMLQKTLHQAIEVRRSKPASNGKDG